MGNTCKPMAVSFQCMTKFTTNKKKTKICKAYSDVLMKKKRDEMYKILLKYSYQKKQRIWKVRVRKMFSIFRDCNKWQYCWNSGFSVGEGIRKDLGNHVEKLSFFTCRKWGATWTKYRRRMTWSKSQLDPTKLSGLDKCALSKMLSTSSLWLCSPWNLSSVTEKLKSWLYLI